MTKKAKSVIVAFVFTMIFWGIPTFLKYLPENIDKTGSRFSIDYWYVGVILLVLAVPAAVMGLNFISRGNK